MTATTQGLAGQGLATGIPAPQGTFGPGFGSVGPGFPPPIGAEQFFGVPSPYGAQAYQQQTPYGTQAQPGYQQQPAGSLPSLQAVQQVAAQIAPIAQQAILPQVIAVAMQQVHQQLLQLVAQLGWPAAVQQLGQWPHQASSQQPGMGLFGQLRPYAYG